MKRQHINFVYFLVVTGAFAFGTWWWLEVRKFQDRAQAAEEKQVLASTRLQEVEKLLMLDSLLLLNDYAAAQELFDRYLLDSLHDHMLVNLSFRQEALKSIMLTESSSFAAESRDSLLQVDTLTVQRAALPKEVRQYDSLYFALAKAKAKVAALEALIQSKSYGEHLVFKSSKGVDVHYVGRVAKGMANGKGMALLSTGSRYEGQWKDNKRHGFGTFYWADGEHYVGEYVNDKRQGTGTYFWPNGEKYVGQWKNDKRSGKGVFYGKDDKVIANGVWLEDELTQVAKSKN